MFREIDEITNDICLEIVRVYSKYCSSVNVDTFQKRVHKFLCSNEYDGRVDFKIDDQHELHVHFLSFVTGWVVVLFDHANEQLGPVAILRESRIAW